MTGRLRNVLGAFRPGEALIAAEPLGRGHIHETFLARCERGDGSPVRYVVQCINRLVFPDPDGLQANLERVTGHLRRALRVRGAADLERRCLTVVPTASGALLHRDAAGEPWRLFPFIAGTHSCDAARDARQARDAASAFGGFVADLADLDPASLVETIPGFHDLQDRLDRLEAAARTGAASVGSELDAARRAAERLLSERAIASSRLPRRIVHNDCKLNNLLFDDATDEALCVIDLDTVMPGSVLSDFGHLVRTVACPAAEDTRNLDEVVFDRRLFRVLVEGFVGGTRGLLSPDEIRAFAFAGPLLTLEDAVRFLTDHLEGDRYFQIQRPGHNLDRARAQLRLVERQFADLSDAISVVEEFADAS